MRSGPVTITTTANIPPGPRSEGGYVSQFPDVLEFLETCMCAGKVALNVQLIRKSGDTGFSQVPSIGESGLGGSTMYVVSKESSNINMLSHGWSYNF